MTNEVNTCCYSNKILTAGGSKVVYLIHELPQVSTNKIWVDPNKHNINKASHHRELCIDSTLLFMLSLIITNFFSFCKKLWSRQIMVHLPHEGSFGSTSYTVLTTYSDSLRNLTLMHYNSIRVLRSYNASGFFCASVSGVYCYS